MVRLCGAALGLLAFGVTILLGLVAGNPPEVTLGRGIRAMLTFCAIGMVTGWVASRVLDEHAVRRQRELLGNTGGSGEAKAGDSSDPERAGARPSASDENGVSKAGQAATES